MDGHCMKKIPHGHYSLDDHWRFTYINRRAAAILKREPDALLGKVLWEEYPYILGTAVERAFRKAKETNIVQYIQPFAIPEMRFFCILAQPDEGGLRIHLYDTQEQTPTDHSFGQISDSKSFLLRLTDAIRLLSDPLDIEEAAIKALGEHLYTGRVIYGDILTLEDMECCALRRVYQRTHEPAPLGVFPLDAMRHLADGLREGRLTIIHDARHDRRWGETERNILESMRVISCVHVPIHKNGRLAACLCVQHFEPRWWTAEEVFLIEETAERTFAAVDRAQAEIALRESRTTALSLVQELETANRNKNEFLSALSHELRNPLATITVGLSLLEAAKHMDEAAYAMAAIKRQMNQLCHLVDDLLDLTRITNNRIRLKREPVELNRLANFALQDARPLFDAKRIKLCFSAAVPSVTLSADPVRIKQIIGNLLHNAHKFTDEGGEVVLSIATEENEAVISVRDNGIGIHPQVLPQLFAPFKQAETSVDRNGGGLGLGLSIVKAIAELHGGSASVHSEGLGQGSRFTIRLPMDVPEEGAPADENTFAAMPRRLKILLIEDQREYACLLSGLLKREGHDCVCAVSGAQGVVLAKEYRPDVIISDIGMPGMDGYEVARRIRGEHGFENTVLVALTGYASRQDIKLAMEAGFHRHLCKPIEIEAVIRTLSELCTQDAGGKGISDDKD